MKKSKRKPKPLVKACVVCNGWFATAGSTRIGPGQLCRSPACKREWDRLRIAWFRHAGTSTNGSADDAGKSLFGGRKPKGALKTSQGVA